MIVRFDSLDRYEMPNMTLCNPGSVYQNGVVSRSIGNIIDTSDEELVLNFNAVSELNFRVNRVTRDDEQENLYAHTLYKSIQNRRLIFVDGIGYFMITEVNDGYSDGTQYKDVKASSADIEIQKRAIPFIQNGTYKFSSDGSDGPIGMIETLIETMPLWTIGTIDENVASRWRTFEDVDTNKNCLSFMMEDMQDAYECIIVFDTIMRTVNVFDQHNYVKKTNIHITKDDLINSLEVSENESDVYTALRVTGGDNVSIAAINPLGTNTLYDFTNYLGWMPGDLGNKVAAWQSEVDAATGEYYDINLQYYEKLADVSAQRAEIERLETQLTMYQRCRSNIVAESSTALVGSYNTVIVNAGGAPVQLYPEVAETLHHIDELYDQCHDRYDLSLATLNVLQDEAENIQARAGVIRDRLSLESYFTADEYQELFNFIFEGNYNDEYIVITDSMSYGERFSQMKVLHDRAKTRLSRVSRPSQEFEIDVENFIFDKAFKEWSEQLETGCLINAELEQDDVAPLFLSVITVNFDDCTLKMTFGNRFNKYDVKSLFDNMLGEISKSANTLTYVKDMLYPIKTGELNHVKEALKNSRNLTMGAAMASDQEEVVIDGSGYTGRRLLDSGVFDPHQIKITGKTIVFTDDAWQSCKIAIGEILSATGDSSYGVNAESIIGDIIMGNNLRIVDNNGEELLSVIDGKINTRVGDVDGRVSMLEQNSTSVDIRIQALESASGDVDHVTTKTGYTFDADGLMISKSGEEMKNLLDNTGMYVTRSDEEVLTANNEGVSAINLRSRQYLIIGQNSRFEDYDDGNGPKRTACFYVGE